MKRMNFTRLHPTLYAVINNKYIDSFEWHPKRSCYDVKHAKIKLLKSKKPGPIRLVDDYSQALLTMLVGVSRLMINDGYLV